MDTHNLKITILGCGDSAGVPRIGGDWGNCDPANPKNRRTRPSIMVQSNTTTIVVDTGPDFGLQLTREKIQKIDDHIGIAMSGLTADGRSLGIQKTIEN